MSEAKETNNTEEKKYSGEMKKVVSGGKDCKDVKDCKNNKSVLDFITPKNKFKSHSSLTLLSPASSTSSSSSLPTLSSSSSSTLSSSTLSSSTLSSSTLSASSLSSLASSSSSLSTVSLSSSPLLSSPSSPFPTLVVNKNCKPIILVSDDDGSRAILFKQWIDKDGADKLFAFSKSLKTKLYAFGIKHNRFLWACGDKGTYHEFKGVEVKIHDWTEETKKVQKLIENAFNVYCNFCLVNDYPNGTYGIAPHSDGELHAANKSVLTLSLGATREMKLVRISRIGDECKVIPFKVEHGDLFLMCGNVQSKWKHGIDPEPSVLDSRHSWTYRSTLLRK